MSNNYKVETKLGPVFIVPTESTHLHLCTSDGEGTNRYVTLRGCEYYISAHFYQWKDGSFHLGNEFAEVRDSNGIHTRSTNLYERFQSMYISNHAASLSARNVLAEVLTQAVNEWVKANTDKLYKAETDHIKDDLDRAKNELKEAQEKVAAIESHIDDLKQKLYAHKGGK